jgi:HlyD family secretion protein
MEIQLDETINLLSKCRIVNPIDGTVLEKYTEAGEVINPGKELYKIADMKTMELKAFVSGAQLSDFSVGDNTMVRIDKGENDHLMIPGIICWVSSEAEYPPEIIQTRRKNVNMVYAFRVLVVNDGKIKIGMPGEVIFHSETP